MSMSGGLTPDGRRLLDEEWVRAATSDQVKIESAPRYGYSFWLRDRGFACTGTNGQIVRVVLRAGLCVCGTRRREVDYNSLLAEFLIYENPDKTVFFIFAAAAPAIGLRLFVRYVTCRKHGWKCARLQIRPGQACHIVYISRPRRRRREKLPLLLYLYGAGHRGDDNTTQVYFEPGISLARAAVGIQKLHTRRTTMSRRNAVGGHSMGGRLIQFDSVPMSRSLGATYELLPLAYQKRACRLRPDIS